MIGLLKLLPPFTLLQPRQSPHTPTKESGMMNMVKVPGRHIHNCQCTMANTLSIRFRIPQNGRYERPRSINRGI